MDSSAIPLFAPAGEDTSLWDDWGLNPTHIQRQLHHALATRTLTPDAAHLRQAAEWLGILHAHNVIHPRFGISEFDDKSCLVHRLSHKHAPDLARELEGESSPLSAIDAAARCLPKESANYAQLAAQLRKRIRPHLLPEDVPAGADGTWHGNRRNLQQLILRDNPCRFLTWPVIINSMFMDDESVAGPELLELKGRADFAARWMPALREDALGAPRPSGLHAESSNNLIHHAYNILQFEAHAGMGIDEVSTILEFGGGYGSTARLVRRLGFQGTYVIFDLPEFSALQRFYLGGLGLEKDVRFVTSKEELRGVCSAPEMFLATWSLSETPVGFREQFWTELEGAKHLLLAYQESFGGSDNVAWFGELSRRRERGRNVDYGIGHLPGNRYMVSWRK